MSVEAMNLWVAGVDLSGWVGVWLDGTSDVIYMSLCWGGGGGACGVLFFLGSTLFFF